MPTIFDCLIRIPKKLTGFIILYLSLVLISSCNIRSDEAVLVREISSAYIAHATEGHLSGFFDCLGRNKIGLISAHRGGPSSQFPENALETISRISELVPVIVELDVMQSHDGVLFLHHDKTLDRTTTGSGRAIEKNWSTLGKLELIDAQGKNSHFTIPTLKEVLDWSHDSAVLQLDVKVPTSIDKVIQAVIDANAGGRVIFIVYSLKDAEKVVRGLPNTYVSVGMNNAGQYRKFLESGIDPKLVQALTGAERDSTAFYQTLNKGGLVVVAGTYGKSDSIDEMIHKERPKKIREKILAAMQKGIQILVTNKPLELYQALSEDTAYKEKLQQCIQPANYNVSR